MMKSVFCGTILLDMILHVNILFDIKSLIMRFILVLCPLRSTFLLAFNFPLTF